MGASILQYFTKDGMRFDLGKAFILPVKNRKNLKILERSYVIKIETSQNNDIKTANGVIFTRDNKTYIARARKEVILSAGAISTPQILLLSGIGPQDHLDSLGIPVVENLPVGKRLVDHVLSLVVFSSNITNDDNLEESIKDLMKFQGPLTRGSLYDAVNFFKTEVEETPNYPDIEFMYNSLDDQSLRQFYGFSDETVKGIIANVVNPFVILLNFLHPKSFGTVTLNSSNPFDYPLINPNFYSDKNNDDIESLYQASQIAIKLIQTEPLRSLNISLVNDRLPGCEHTKPSSREYWYCYLRRVTMVGYHPISTCAMGTDPKTAVVDKRLKIFGIDRLRVADASVIPVPMTGHTVVPCTVVGEKLAEFIKDLYKS